MSVDMVTLSVLQTGTGTRDTGTAHLRFPRASCYTQKTCDILLFPLGKDMWGDVGHESVPSFSVDT
jgi:hypothetical protein